jgi:putative acetyltransferase
MRIRDEQEDDAAAIRAVTMAAFETMPYSSQTEAAIIEALRAAGALTVSLVAVEDDQVVGHIAFSPSPSARPPSRDGMASALSP